MKTDVNVWWCGVNVVYEIQTRQHPQTDSTAQLSLNASIAALISGGGEIMGCPRRNVIEFYKRLHDQLIVKDKQSGKHQHLRQYIPQLWLFKISKGVLSPLLMNARNEVERWTKKNETPANKRVSSLKSRFCGRHASSLRSRDGGRLSHAVVLDLIRRCGVSLARLCSGSVVRDHQLFGKENRRFH